MEFAAFVYNLSDEGLVEVETCRRDIMSVKWLLLIVQFVGLSSVWSACCMEYGLQYYLARRYSSL
jgi:hypothetical protein